MVPTGAQIGLTRLGAASTTTSRFVAQERMKPKPFVPTPKFGPPLRISGGAGLTEFVTTTVKVIEALFNGFKLS